MSIHRHLHYPELLKPGVLFGQLRRECYGITTCLTRLMVYRRHASNGIHQTNKLDTDRLTMEEGPHGITL